ncbi:MAG: hypothetical protein FJ104_06895 [Deltaproteobacteria bacterium]|nr:hypothetical protein [Deltaproteobacteria bacterium]
MNRMQKGGGCLTLLAIPFFCLAVMMLLDPKEGEGPAKSLAPGLFFGSVLLFPGLVLYGYGRRLGRDREFYEAVKGMVRSHDRFTVEELARKIGRTELETEGIVARIVAEENGIDLVFHRPTREYLHRARLSAGQRVVEQCASCGAPTQHAVVFEGEQVACTFCGAPLVAEG